MNSAQVAAVLGILAWLLMVQTTLGQRKWRGECTNNEPRVV